MHFGGESLPDMAFKTGKGSAPHDGHKMYVVFYVFAKVVQCPFVFDLHFLPNLSANIIFSLNFQQSLTKIGLYRPYKSYKTYKSFYNVTFLS